jgi:hypothetical protein
MKHLPLDCATVTLMAQVALMAHPSQGDLWVGVMVADVVPGLADHSGIWAAGSTIPEIQRVHHYAANLLVDLLDRVNARQQISDAIGLRDDLRSAASPKLCR